MKALKYIALASSLALACCSFSALAQNESTASIVRRAKLDSKKTPTGKQVTDRMQNFFETSQKGDADVEWMRIIYRQLNLLEFEQNAALYYPEEPNEDGQNLFFIIMRLLAQGKLNAYEYLDGKEMFTEKYQIKVKDMMDRFHILYSNAKGSTEKKPLFTIEDSDVPANEVLSYYVIERYDFDRRKGEISRRVQAICPVLHRSDDFGGDAIKYPMFWIKMEDLRPFIAQQYVFTSNDNNLAKYSYDDYFMNCLYKGEIYKFKNLRNLSMMQMYPDPDDRKHAQDSIEKRLVSFDQNLWVPSREELQARAEAAEAAEAAKEQGEEIASRDGTSPAKETTVKKSTRSTKRGAKQSSSKSSSTKKKSSTKKSSKKASSSTTKTAVRSVRARK